MREKYIDHADLRQEDFPKSVSKMIQLVGVENTVKIMREFGGRQIWIPHIDHLERLQRYRKIREEYTGGNLSEMAAKYNMPVSTFHYVVTLAQREGDE